VEKIVKTGKKVRRKRKAGRKKTKNNETPIEKKKLPASG